MTMRLVIDESSWQFDQLSLKDCRDALERLMDQIAQAQTHGHGVCYSEELFHQAVWQDKTFYELQAKDSGFTIPRDIIERLSTLINGLPTWQELEWAMPLADGDQVHLKDEPQHAASIAWAHQQAKADHAIACLIFAHIYTAGCHQLTVGNQTAPVWLVADSKTYQDFFRWIIRETSKNPAEMAQLAESAFLQLDFYPDAFHGIKDMSKPYRKLVDDLVRHLAALSDYGPKIFSGPWDQAAANFGQYGVDVSPESGNTKNNQKAKGQRTLQHQEKQVICWWHSKLERHQDRIHFYPDDAKTSGRILVGIFCKHLDT